MKQLKKRALFMLMSLMTLICVKAATVITIDGLQYSLSGAYASVYGIASGNTNRTISIPSQIVYNGNTYVVDELRPACFCNYYEDSSGKRYYVTDGKSEDGAPYNKYTKAGTGFDKQAYYNSRIREIILPNTITSIGDYAFSNRNLTTIKLNEGVKIIGESAFSITSKITSIIIPSTVETMGYYCFSGCSLLRKIIYLSSSAPQHWTATSFTYVPNKAVYGNPTYAINNASVIEMITFSQSEFEYTGKAPNPIWTNNMEEYTASFTMPTLQSEVGSYEEVIPVTFTKGEESFTANIPYSYTIVPTKLKAKVNSTSRTYGEANPDFTITYSGFVNGEDESALITKPVVTTSADKKSAAGVYPITISGGKAKNYTIEYEQGELTVNKASLAIQVIDANKIYGSSNPTFALGYSGLKNEETVPEWTAEPKFTTSATKESGVGTYDITVTCEPKNYEITSNTPGKLTIQKTPLTVKANNVSIDYCGTMPSYSFTYSGFVNNDTEDALSTKPSIATEATATSNAGTYSITPEGAQANNYDFSYTAGTLTINKRPLTVKANSVSRQYGENNPDFTIEYEGFVNEETKEVLEVEPNVSTTATIQSNAGSYDIRASGGQAKNYSLSYQNGQLNITPRPLKAFVDNYERAYGENNPTFEILYEGLAGNDTGYSLYTQPMARCSATRTSNVGTYTIEVTGGYSPNYTLTYGSGQLTIVKAEQTFTWNQDLTNLKVGDQVELQANASSNLPITFTMDSNDYAEIYKAGSKTFMECKKAGSFHIKAVQEGNDNYYSTSRINKEATLVGEEEYNPSRFIKQADNGMVSTKVNKGSSCTFTIYVESGWKIHSVTFNGTDVTDKLDSNNSYTTPEINENSTLHVIYEQNTSNTRAAICSEVNVKVVDDGVVISNAKPDSQCVVFLANGQQVVNTVIRNDNHRITLHKGQVYLLKIDGKTFKFAL